MVDVDPRASSRRRHLPRVAEGEPLPVQAGDVQAPPYSCVLVSAPRRGVRPSAARLKQCGLVVVARCEGLIPAVSMAADLRADAILADTALLTQAGVATVEYACAIAPVPVFAIGTLPDAESALALARSGVDAFLALDGVATTAFALLAARRHLRGRAELIATREALVDLRDVTRAVGMISGAEFRETVATAQQAIARRAVEAGMTFGHAARCIRIECEARHPLDY
jgi:hypothetical protein